MRHNNIFLPPDRAARSGASSKVLVFLVASTRSLRSSGRDSIARSFRFRAVVTGTLLLLARRVPVGTRKPPPRHARGPRCGAGRAWGHGHGWRHHAESAHRGTMARHETKPMNQGNRLLAARRALWLRPARRARGIPRPVGALVLAHAPLPATAAPSVPVQWRSQEFAAGYTKFQSKYTI